MKPRTAWRQMAVELVIFSRYTSLHTQGARRVCVQTSLRYEDEVCKARQSKQLGIVVYCLCVKVLLDIEIYSRMLVFSLMILELIVT